MRTTLASVVACLAAVLLLGPAARAQADGVGRPDPDRGAYIQCGALIVRADQPALGPSTIIVRDGVIERVVEGHVRGREGPLIDLREHTVLPGLIDCHTHITGQYSRDVRLRSVTESDADAAVKGVVYARRTLDAGFTTIRNVGSTGDAAFALRDAIARGDVPGPRILVAGESITPTGGHSDSTLGYREDLFDPPGAAEGVADGVAGVRAAVRAQVARGADVIKLTATGGVLSNTAAGVEVQFFDDELRAIVETARLLGRKVAAHAHGASGINAALRAGVDSIEHGTFLDEESIRLFNSTGAFLVPTVHAGKFVQFKAEEEGYFPPAVRHKAARVGPQIQDALRRAHEGGVRIAFGTDVGVGEHGTNAEEFVYMHEAGMPPRACLVAATLHAAELLGMAETIGSIEPGKAADIIAVEGDPLADVRTLLDVRFVMSNGLVHKRPR